MSEAVAQAQQQGKKGLGEKESEAGKALLSLLIDKETTGSTTTITAAATEQQQGKTGEVGTDDGKEEDDNASPVTVPFSSSKRSSPGAFMVRPSGHPLLPTHPWID